MNIHITLGWIILSLTFQTGNSSDSKSLSDRVEDMLQEPRYNSRARPGADTGEPLKVFININVNDISSISEMKMEFSTTLYLRQIWRDDRLSFEDESNRNITLHHKQFDRIWTPDVFIRNLKAGTFHSITVPNRLIRLSPDGTILYSQRLTLTLACDMILNKYPMDNQTCKIEFGSYAYTTDDLVFHWRTDAKAVEVNNAISLPEYDLKNVSEMVCTQNINSTGNFPCLRAYFHLERRLRAYVLSTFLPSLLIVLLSWVSFWIDLDAVPARISLGILTMLTMTTQSSGHLRGMPAVSFTKAIDVWMATCLVFVFGSFIEYSVVNVLARKEKAKKARGTSVTMPAVIVNRQEHVESNYSWYTLFHRKAHKQSKQVEIQEMIPLTNAPSADESNLDQSPARCIRNHGSVSVSSSRTYVDGQMNGSGSGGKTGSRGCFKRFMYSKSNSQAQMVDCMSRVLFPTMFIIFNMIYWPFYLIF